MWSCYNLYIIKNLKFSSLNKDSAIPIILFNEIIIPKKPSFLDDFNIDPFSSYNVDKYAMKSSICTLILSMFSFVKSVKKAQRIKIGCAPVSYII